MPRTPSSRSPEPDAGARHPALDYRPPRWLRALRWGAWSLGAALLIACLHTAYWFYMAGSVREGVTAWIAERRAAGAVVSFREMRLSGFPFHLRLSVEAPTYADPTAKHPWAWEAEHLEATARPWSPQRVTLRAPGEQALLPSADPATLLRGRAETLTARLQLAGGTVENAEVEIAGAALRTSSGEAAYILDHMAATAERQPDPQAGPRTPTFEMHLALRGLSLPAALNLPLGQRIGRFELSASLLGPLPERPEADPLARWRDAGGTVEVHRLAADYGPLRLSAEGTLALDEALQPVGSLTARAEGFFETLDALRERHLVAPKAAVTAKMVLGVLARRNADGAAHLTLPLTLQDRELHAGPVPLMALPTVRWPGQPADAVAPR